MKFRYSTGDLRPATLQRDGVDSNVYVGPDTQGNPNIFISRFGSQIKKGDCLKIKGVEHADYLVESVEDIENGRRWLCLHCKRLL